MTKETQAHPLPGILGLFLFLGLLAVSTWFVFRASPIEPYVLSVSLGIFGFLVATLVLNGLFTVQPNQAVVLILLGNYSGTVRTPGWWFTNPIMSKKRVSLRVHSLNGEKLKVNDQDGNPVEIAAVTVWRVRDSAQAIFDVEKYVEFVAVQSETCVRHLASQYPYDSHDDVTLSLRGSMDQIADTLSTELQTRLDKAGVEVIEARLSHLAYGPEIASAMLRRQQAGAVVAARMRIVDGAVGMVEMALERLAQRHTVEFDEEKKAAMVSNLLVVLCSEQAASPVINAGTLHT
ncbi:MAG: SPFH domain-containing protein [Candidatus Eiseniibacteriota bacterium]